MEHHSCFGRIDFHFLVELPLKPNFLGLPRNFFESFNDILFDILLKSEISVCS